ncbi:MAG: porin, partial [Alphaproteobacteria bacterium]
AGDTSAADEAYAYLDSDSWGRVEMGDQDDVTDRMHIAAHNILVGRAGADGDPADFIGFGTGSGISAPGVDSTSDDTKISYFSPRFFSFRVGASLTPDSGATSGGAATADSDADGNFENVLGLAANYSGNFDDVAIEVGIIGEFGDSETAGGAATEGEIETIGVGATVEFAGFGIGAEYVDFAEKGVAEATRTAGGDAGSYYQLGVAYKTGPWGVSLGWFDSSVSNPTGSGGDTDINILSFDASYDVAPGWELMASLHLAEGDNINATAIEVDNDGTAFVISNQFDF